MTYRCRAAALSGCVVGISLLSGAAIASGQPLEAATRATVIERRELEDLPGGDNVFSVLETVDAEVISDHFYGAVNGAQAARIGSFLGSWTQTLYRVSGIDISLPGAGVPAFVPSLRMWERIRIEHGPSATGGASPLIIDLEPRRAQDDWRVAVTAFGSGGPLVASGEGRAPRIARLRGASHFGLLTSGPLFDQTLVVASVSRSRVSQQERARTWMSEHALDSGYLHAVTDLAGGARWSMFAAGQAAAYPAADKALTNPVEGDREFRTLHAQSRYERPLTPRMTWSASGALTRRRTTVNTPFTNLLTVDRVLDGPVPLMASDGSGKERRGSLAASLDVNGNAFGVTHTIDTGAELARTAFEAAGGPGFDVQEFVAGIPARMWHYSPASASSRRLVQLSGYITDRVVLANRLTLDAGLRVEHLRGGVADRSAAFSWTTLIPRAAIAWDLVRSYRWSLFSGVSRLAETPSLQVLAAGDPAERTAAVYRWDGSAQGRLVAFAGPGAGAAGTLVTIDRSLKRPVARELVVGMAAQPDGWPRLRFSAVWRSAAHQLALVNTGVPIDSYDVHGLPDPGANLLAPDDDVVLPIYDRRPETFGEDRYLLTNSSVAPGTYRAIVLTTDWSSERWFLLLGGTYGQTAAVAAYRGFGALENDPANVGEFLADPNATTHARGNIFTDRQYTGKIATVVRFANDVAVGAVGRYQDGQPFSRLVILPDLNQGVEAIRAFRSGKSRFAFTGTLDVRVSKGFTAGARRVEAFIECYNCPNMRKEVEEWVVTGADFRRTTALQPPRSVQVGMQFEF